MTDFAIILGANYRSEVLLVLQSTLKLLENINLYYGEFKYDMKINIFKFYHIPVKQNISITIVNLIFIFITFVNA